MLRFAQFGAGRIGAIHAANLAAMRDTQLLHVVDVNAEAARTLATRHGARVSTVTEALGDPPGIENVLADGEKASGLGIAVGVSTPFVAQ
jgi:predicted dehydrogenase